MPPVIKSAAYHKIISQHLQEAAMYRKSAQLLRKRIKHPDFPKSAIHSTEAEISDHIRKAKKELEEARKLRLGK